MKNTVSNIHAGHGCKDSKSQGASGYISESIANRNILNYFKEYCIINNEITYDCTVDYPKNAKDCLNQIVAKCNKNKVDIDISIHLNAGSPGNGVECWTYDNKSKANSYAKDICKNIAELGYRNRGVKHSTNYAVLKTKNPNIIVECCFVDSKDDADRFNAKDIARAIFKAVYGYSPLEHHKPKNGILYGNDVDYLITELICWDKKDYEPCHIDQHYLWQYSNLIVVGMDAVKKMREHFPQENYHIIAGEDRWVTTRQALKFLGRY